MSAGQGQEPSGERLIVAVLAGGRSSEHDVSLASAAAVRDGLRAAGHEVIWVEIGRDAVWRLEGRQLSVTPGGGFLDADVVFPVLHGPFGEDGTVQGMLETLDVPYVGAGVAASALCLDKVRFKQLMYAVEIPQVRYVGLDAVRFAAAAGEVIAEVADLGLPVFVKPARLGSSLGIVKVSDEDAVAGALESALAHDELVIVEAMSTGIEVECGVLGVPHSGGEAGSGPPVASEPGEIVISGEWYDYDAKYAPGGMELRIPAAISAAARERVRELAVLTFIASGCEGLARVDFFVTGESVLVNELNTMPGFTPTSVYAKLFDASGVPYATLVDRLCRLACERHERRRALTF